MGGTWIMPCITRTCSRCHLETDEEYSEDEWDQRGQICEQCETEELIVLDII